MSEEVIIKVKVPKEMKEQIEREIKIIVDERRRKLDIFKRIVGILKEEGKSYKELKVEKYEDIG